MFKPTPALQGNLRRLPLTTKQAGREYYKGNRVGSMGTIDKHGKFHPDFTKLRTYVYPFGGVKGFEVRTRSYIHPNTKVSSQILDVV
jgi:large subunit ribosomal protein L41